MLRIKQIFIGLLTVHAIASLATGERTKKTDLKMPLLDNKRAPLMATFDMTDINEHIQAYVDEAIESSLSQQIEQKTKEAITAEIESVVKNCSETGNRVGPSASEIGATTSVIRNNVAFTAILLKDVPVLFFGNKQIIRYNNVITNIGNAYDSATGIFSVPTSGVYSLSVSMMGYHSNGVHLQLTKNGNEVVRLWTGGVRRHEIGSHTINIELAQNDKVWVQCRESGGAKLYGLEGYNIFSGALLFELA